MLLYARYTHTSKYFETHSSCRESIPLKALAGMVSSLLTSRYLLQHDDVETPDAATIYRVTGVVNVDKRF